MRIAIIGCGWVGERLAKFLAAKGNHVIATTTSTENLTMLKNVATEVHLLDFTTTLNFDFLDAVEVAIFSMPISRNSWHQGFDHLNQKFPKTLLFSSTGIYPTQSGVYSEEHTADLRSDIASSENLIRHKYPQTNILRFGGLMGDERSLQNFFKNRLPENPAKATNYIHYQDILAAVALLLPSEIKAETYNIVAPEHPTIAEVLQLENPGTKDPASASEQRIVSSQKFIQDFNYTFIHPNPKYF